MVQPGGKVVGIEHLPELSELATKNIAKDPEHKKMMDEGILKIVTGDGRLGYPDEGKLPLVAPRKDRINGRRTLRRYPCWRRCSCTPQSPPNFPSVYGGNVC
jgi:Protein-L-isoaspartate(D-aspartate) O-methyltransferase (PCMT)